MQKIPSVFCRNYDGDRLVRNEVVTGSEWVLAGEGTATRKWDGTACLVRNGQLFKRHDMKAKKLAQGKKPPEGWEPCEPAPDEKSGHWPGWLLIGDGPEDKWHREAWDREASGFGVAFRSATYELCGPKINGNPEGLDEHVLIKHGKDRIEHLSASPLSFASIRILLESMSAEGIVWYHPDGRMAKIKRKDFGLTWPL